MKSLLDLNHTLSLLQSNGPNAGDFQMSNESVSDIGVSQNSGILTVSTSLDFAAWRIAAQAWEKRRFRANF
jgi:hypothetical protein